MPSSSHHSRLSRRRFLRGTGLLAGAGLSAPLLGACNPVPSGSTGADTDAAAGDGGGGGAGSSTVNLWTFAGTHARWYEAMAETYTQEVNPDFQLNLEQVGTAADLADRLLVSLQAGTGAPDIADIEQGPFGSFLRGPETGLVDLRPRLEEGNYLEDYVENRLTLYSDGEAYFGLEHALVPVGLYYRVDIWEQAGVDPQTFETWDDYLAGAQEVSTDERKALVWLGAIHDLLLRQRGGDYFTPDGEVTLDSELSIDTMNWILATRDEHGIGAPPPVVDSIDGPEIMNAYQNGQFVSFMGADWYGGFLKDLLPDMAGQWRLAALPAWEPGGSRTSSWGGTGACIVDSSPAIEEAWNFLEYCHLTLEGNIRQFELINLFPPYIPALESDALLIEDPYFGGQVLGELYQELAPQVPAQNQNAFRTQLLNELEVVTPQIYSGQVAPEVALTNVASSVRQAQGR